MTDEEIQSYLGTTGLGEAIREIAQELKDKDVPEEDRMEIVSLLVRAAVKDCKEFLSAN